MCHGSSLNENGPFTRRMETVVWLDETEPRQVEPSAGWNASATAQDRVRWAGLYTGYVRKGLKPREASTEASKAMFQHQMPHLMFRKARA